MTVTMPKFDLARSWQPLAKSFEAFGNDSLAFADCADSVLHEVEAIQREVLAKAREVDQLAAQLALREVQLADQRSNFASLAGRFDQQAAQFNDALDEIRNLRSELALRPDSASAALAQARELWQGDRTEILERLSALAMMQQTGSGDSDAVQAFCRELTEMQKLIGASHAQTQASLQKEFSEVSGHLASLTTSLAQLPSDAAPLDQLGAALSELRDQVAELQVDSATTARESMEKLLARLEKLAESQPVANDPTPLIAAVLESLVETKRLVENVRSESGSQSRSHEATIAALRSEIVDLRRASEAQASIALPKVDDELIAAMHGEIESLRQQSTSARQDAEAARQSASRQETERTLVESELDRLRTQAAQWRRELEEESSRHHDEERLWREELHDLRQLIHQAAAAMSSPPEPVAVAARPAGDKPAESHEGDAVANSLMAQFSKLQKDSARRRTRGSNT